MSGQIAALEAAIARWNAGDLQGYLGLYAPHIRLHGYGPAPLDFSAAKGFYQMIWAGLHAQGSSHPHLVVEEAFVSDNCLSCRATMAGHHTGHFMGTPAKGKPYLLPVITVLHFEGGQVAERWSSADMLGLLTQIGAVRLPG